MPMPVYSGEKLKLTVDRGDIIIAMYDNTAADAFLERLPLENLSLTCRVLKNRYSSRKNRSCWVKRSRVLRR